MLISFDKTDFPLIAIEKIGVEVHLLPIAKAQFEQFVAVSPLVKESCYRKMLALNPATSLDEFTVEQREQLFVSGVLPEEAIMFARWLGKGFDLPTVDEWRAIMATLKKESPPRQRPLTDALEGAALSIITKFEEHLHIRTMLDYSLMRGGLVEWVRQDKQLVGLGAPRLEFHPNLWDPLFNEIKPIQPEKRVPYFGFRLVRRGNWYLKDRKRATALF